MSMIQYCLCGIYSFLGIALIGLIISQKEQEKSTISTMSGNNDNYYSRNMKGSSEYKKRMWTKILAFSFFAVNAVHLFYSVSIR